MRHETPLQIWNRFTKFLGGTTADLEEAERFRRLRNDVVRRRLRLGSKTVYRDGNRIYSITQDRDVANQLRWFAEGKKRPTAEDFYEWNRDIRNSAVLARMMELRGLGWIRDRGTDLIYPKVAVLASYQGVVVLRPEFSRTTSKCEETGYYYDTRWLRRTVIVGLDSDGTYVTSQIPEPIARLPEISEKIIQVRINGQDIYVYRHVLEANPEAFSEDAAFGNTCRPISSYGTAGHELRGLDDPLEGLTVGIEVEVSFPNRSQREERARSLTQMVRKAAGLNRWALVEEDTSVIAGFELVTGWAYIDRMKEILNTLYSHQINGKYVDPFAGISIDSSCGFHVHVGTASTPVGTAAAVDLWVNGIRGTQWEGVMTRIAGRPENRYCRRLAPGSRGGSRYLAVNAGGSSTVEFRMFAGTTKREEMFRYIEFAHSAVAFTAACLKGERDGGAAAVLRGEDGVPTYEEDPSVVWRDYFRFVQESEKEYPVLAYFTRAEGGL